MARKLVSADEGAECTGLAPSTLRKLAWQQKIRSYKVLGALRFRLEDLEALIQERPAIRSANATVVRANKAEEVGEVER
jgi:hypothetical protein